MPPAPTRKKAPAAPPAPAPAAFYFRAWHAFAGFALAGLALLTVYGSALDGPFVLDDLNLPFAHPEVEHLDLNAWTAMRPLLQLTYYANYRISGQQVVAYHATNLLLHLIAGALVFFILRRILSFWSEPEPRLSWLALFGAGLFLFHPIQTEAVAYIASRSDVLSTVFAYAAIAVYVYRRREETGLGFLDVIAILALFVCAVSCKEQAAVLPFLFVLFDYFTFQPFTLAGIRRNWRLHLPVALAGIYGTARVIHSLQLSGGTAGFGVAGVSWYQYFFTECRVIWHYLRLVALPIGQNVDPDFPFSKSLADPSAIAGFVALHGVSVAAWIYKKRFPLAALGWFTFLLLLAPTSSFVPIIDPAAERRVYWPFLGMALIAIEVFRQLKISAAAARLAMAVILLVCAALTWSRAAVWSSNMDLWSDAVAKSPHKYRPHFQLAYAYYQAQQFELANAEFARAAELQTPDVRLLVDWALALDAAGKGDEAVNRLNQALQREGSAHIFATIGMVRAKQGRYEEALSALGHAELSNPRFVMTYVYRGNIYRLMNRLQDAAEAYRKALQIDRGNAVAFQGLQAVEAQLRLTPPTPPLKH